jgi:ribonuclease HI
MEAVTIFTDTSGCGAAAYHTKDCYKVEHTVFVSAQRVELYTVVMVLMDFLQQPIILYSDSHYVVSVLCCIETAYIGHTRSEELLNLFFQLCCLFCETFILTF